MRILPRKFYERDPALVARSLLGKILVREVNSKILSGKIVETEAYYGKKDPASRAYSGRPKFCAKLMHGKPGVTLIYMVHNNWLLNFVAHRRNETGAVLIRAIEPLEGIETMKMNRRVDDLYRLTNGPGKLTKALAITKELNGIDVTDGKSKLVVVEGCKEKFKVSSSRRIGVRKDLPQNLRFFVKESKFVSK
jgi:DNA-3-methyladenine glycosylase